MKTNKSKSSPRMSGLVVAALRNLRDAHGSTAREIMKYIMAEYNASEMTVQRQLKTALKRGVEYGILKKTNNEYSLNTEAEVIGPLDLAQVDACGKKRKRVKKYSCKPKRKSCRKPKRSACPRKRSSCPRKKKRKRNPCNMCAARGRRGDCSRPVQLVRDNTPTLDEDRTAPATTEGDKTNEENDQDRASRSRSISQSKSNRSRSRSLKYSGSENDEDRIDDDL